jgi:hypothetical protein
MTSPALVQKLWNYCNILRDDGLSYGDYVEQLTFLLFLKMADEQSRPPFAKPNPIPKGFGWEVLVSLDGDALETHYRHTLDTLGKCPGSYDELIKRDKVNLDIFWLKDDALEDSANLPAPGVIATEIVEDLRAALEQFAEIEADLKE